MGAGLAADSGADTAPATALVTPATGPDCGVVLPADPAEPAEVGALEADDGAEVGVADVGDDDGAGDVVADAGAEDVVEDGAAAGVDGAAAGVDGAAAGGLPAPAGAEVSWVVAELTALVAVPTTDPTGEVTADGRSPETGEVVRAGGGRSARVAA